MRNDVACLNVETLAVQSLGKPRLPQQTTALALRLAMWLQTASVLGSGLYVIGGQHDPRAKESYVLRWQLQSEPAESWFAFSPVQFLDVTYTGCESRDCGIAGHSAIVLGEDELLVFGGMREDGSTTDRLFRVRVTEAAAAVTSVAASGTLPGPRWCQGCASLPGKRTAAIFGGWHRQSNLFLDDLHLLDLDTLSWSQIRNQAARMPAARCQCTLVAVGVPGCGCPGGLLLFGGASQNAEARRNGELYGNVVIDMSDFWWFDFSSSSWICCETTYWPLRGGVNGSLLLGEGPESLLLIGGMHSDPGASMPDFSDEIVELSLPLPIPQHATLYT
eukprot:TRINITY_DN21218_c0_g1_i10.p1 TRINITY_DN21218_c0_g1~~TRINITY_DN21218_c0_g1_i10.p1  ORF type:complete len:333 (-),score=15.51 TRINITY_DN21218_c0_g1_i10:55-1053(-)